MSKLSKAYKKYKSNNKKYKSNNKRPSTWLYSEDIASASQGDRIIIGITTIDEYIQHGIGQSKFDSRESFFNDKIKLISTKKEWNEFTNKFVPEFEVYQTRDYCGFIVDPKGNGYLSYYVSGDTITVDIVGNQSFVSSNRTFLETNFQTVQSYVKWIHDTNGGYITVSLNDDKLPITEMYPFLGEESLSDFYDRFMKSSASVLLLIGPPGCGKTTFARGLLHHAKTSATVTYDPGILARDSIYADWLEDDESSILVLEDSDTFLANRTSGNDLMHKFLNVGDGLVSMKGKKMIFSTNLPSVRDVDQALLRPGRCFAVLKFDYLTKEQAHRLADKMGVELVEEKDKYIVADIFHAANTQPIQKFGFNQ